MLIFYISSYLYAAELVLIYFLIIYQHYVLDPDDLDGTDSARKAVIIANSLFHKPMRLKDLKYSGIDENNIKKNEMLLAKISMNKEFSVESRVFTLKSEDPFLRLAPMGMACSIGFKERNPVYISEDMDGPLETAGAVLSDILSV